MRSLTYVSNCLVEKTISDQLHKAKPQISLERNPSLLVTDPGFDLSEPGQDPSYTLFGLV